MKIAYLAPDAPFWSFGYYRCQRIANWATDKTPKGKLWQHCRMESAPSRCMGSCHYHPQSNISRQKAAASDWRIISQRVSEWTGDRIMRESLKTAKGRIDKLALELGFTYIHFTFSWSKAQRSNWYERKQTRSKRHRNAEYLRCKTDHHKGSGRKVISH